MLVQQFLDGILLSPAPTNQLHDPLRPKFLGGAVGVNRRSLFVPSTFDHHGPNLAILVHRARGLQVGDRFGFPEDRKSTRLNSSHVEISYAVFCLKKKKKKKSLKCYEYID